MIKKCSKCGCWKSLGYFFKDNSSKCGLKSHCKSCFSIYIGEYRKNNKIKIKEVYSNWYNKNKNSNKYRKQKNEYRKQKLKTDIEFKLSCYLRTRLNHAINRNQRAGSAVKDLGCSIKELKKHLESQFKSGMTWDNHGKWHIDHIVPLASFDLTDRLQFLEACNYTNLQPLWSKENLSKSDKTL